MVEITRIGMDTSKNIFQLHGVDVHEQVVLKKKVRRQDLVKELSKLPATEIGMEASGESHHWARVSRSLGHEPRLMPAQLVKPYVQRNKNDAADADAACEAMSRPRMRFIAVKTVDQQAALMLFSVREGLVRRRTQLGNKIRGHAREFGLVAPKGTARVPGLVARAVEDETLPDLARELFAGMGREYAQLEADLAVLDKRAKAWHRGDERARRLVEIEGIGPIGAALLALRAPDPALFDSGRDFAAWIGLTPRDHSTAGKTRIGGITRAGDETLRSVLVEGATAVIRQARRGKGPVSPWLADLLKRKKPKHVAIALANRNARVAWKLMVSGQTYQPRGSRVPVRRDH